MAKDGSSAYVLGTSESAVAAAAVTSAKMWSLNDSSGLVLFFAFGLCGALQRGFDVNIAFDWWRPDVQHEVGLEVKFVCEWLGPDVQHEPAFEVTIACEWWRPDVHHEGGFEVPFVSAWLGAEVAEALREFVEWPLELEQRRWAGPAPAA